MLLFLKCDMKLGAIKVSLVKISERSARWKHLLLYLPKSKYRTNIRSGQGKLEEQSGITNSLLIPLWEIQVVPAPARVEIRSPSGQPYLHLET